jgi:Pyridoxal-phosphate dependent enzyme
MSGSGPNRTSRSVRCSSVIGSKSDIEHVALPPRATRPSVPQTAKQLDVEASPRYIESNYVPSLPLSNAPDMCDAETPLGLPSIRDARAVLAGRLAPSPCLPVDDGQARPGRLFVKAENLMPTGSFKIRGATYRISLLTATERRRGVIAYSTGNHAQAVAKAARDAGVAATIVMSPDVLPVKVAATEKWGAEVVMAEPSSHAPGACRADCQRVRPCSGSALR